MSEFSVEEIFDTYKHFHDATVLNWHLKREHPGNFDAELKLAALNKYNSLWQEVVFRFYRCSFIGLQYDTASFYGTLQIAIGIRSQHEELVANIGGALNLTGENVESENIIRCKAITIDSSLGQAKRSA